jgi:hypothetical protein
VKTSTRRALLRGDRGRDPAASPERDRIDRVIATEGQTVEVCCEVCCNVVVDGKAVESRLVQGEADSHDFRRNPTTAA